MKLEDPLSITLPKENGHEVEPLWSVLGKENSDIADKVERCADMYIRRIQHAMKIADEYRAMKAKNPDHWEYGASEHVDLGWYNDLVAAAEDARSATRMAEVLSLPDWTQEDFTLLVESINAASPEIHNLLENRQIKRNNYKPGYEEDESEQVIEDPAALITRMINGGRNIDTDALEELLIELEEGGRAVPSDLAKDVFGWQLSRMIDGVPGTRESDASWRILQKLRSR